MLKGYVDRSTLFLTELICTLFVFSICAVLCVGLLLKASALIQESQELTDAVYLAQSTAEQLRHGNTPAKQQDVYDINWNTELGRSPGICYADVTISINDRVIYMLTTAWPQETVYHE